MKAKDDIGLTSSVGGWNGKDDNLFGIVLKKVIKVRGSLFRYCTHAGKMFTTSKYLYGFCNIFRKTRKYAIYQEQKMKWEDIHFYDLTVIIFRTLHFIFQKTKNRKKSVQM